MKTCILIIISFFILFPLNAGSIQVQLAKERDQITNNVTTDEKKIWLNGVMNKITKKFVIINGKEYGISKDTVIRYPGGKIIKNIAIFRGTESANISAWIDEGIVKELVIEGLELRH